MPKHRCSRPLKRSFPTSYWCGLSAGIHNYPLEEIISSLLGKDSAFGVIIATVAGVPMYADIFGTIPIAAALLYKGAQLGTELVPVINGKVVSAGSLLSPAEITALSK